MESITYVTVIDLTESKLTTISISFGMEEGEDQGGYLDNLISQLLSA